MPTHTYLCLHRAKPISPGQNSTITIHYEAKISLPSTINDSFSGGLSDIPSAYLKYTSADKYWEVNDVTIRSLSQNLTKNEGSVLNKVRSIYNYTIERISYDDAKFQAILRGEPAERYGAVKTLALGRGVCEDISDLFTTLCRASGIPAIVVSGPIYSKDGEVTSADCHAWTEVYIPGYGWLDVDPTWKLFGRLEGRHIADRLSKNSSQPDYIGWVVYQSFSYELKRNVKLLTGEVTYGPDLSISADYTGRAQVGSTVTLKLTVKNYGNGTAYSSNVTVSTSDNLRLQNASAYSFSDIRSYDTRTITLVANATAVGSDSFTVNLEYGLEGGRTSKRTFTYYVNTTKISGMATCNIAPDYIEAFKDASLDYSITPAYSTNVAVTIVRPDGSVFEVRNLATEGSFTIHFMPDVSGLWTVRMDVPESTACGPIHEDRSFSVHKTSVEISASSSTSESGIVTRGHTTPNTARPINITLVYTLPNGTALTKEVTTDTQGGFVDLLSGVKAEGNLTVAIFWSGDGAYLPSNATFITELKGTFDETFVIGVAIIVIVAIAAVILLVKRRGQPRREGV